MLTRPIAQLGWLGWVQLGVIDAALLVGFVVLAFEARPWFYRRLFVWRCSRETRQLIRLHERRRRGQRQHPTTPPRAVR